MRGAVIKRALSAVALACMLAGCASAPDEPNGCIAYSPSVPMVASFGRVCATQLDEHWAVSVKHGTKVLNTSLGPSDLVRSRDYDLVFFRHEGPAPEWRLEGLRMDEPVTAAGNPGSLLDYVVALPVPNRGKATGKIVAKAWYCGSKDTPMIECAWAIAFDGPVEPGYSGGPLVDAEGRVIGITIARTGESIPLSDGGVMPAGTGIALPAALVWSEFRRLVPAQAPIDDTPTAGGTPGLVGSDQPSTPVGHQRGPDGEAITK